MLAKAWKKVLLIFLIIACLINIILKLTNVISFSATIESIKSKIKTETTIVQNNNQ